MNVGILGNFGFILYASAFSVFSIIDMNYLWGRESVYVTSYIGLWKVWKIKNHSVFPPVTLTQHTDA